MITGKGLIERGWPQGRTIGLALAATDLRAAGMDDDAIFRELERVRENPDADTQAALEPLSRELASIRAEKTAALEDRLRGEALAYGVWGPDLIEEGTTAQMEGAMRLPVSIGGALMPDAHLGYGLPVGGVLAGSASISTTSAPSEAALRMACSKSKRPSRYAPATPTGARSPA